METSNLTRVIGCLFMLILAGLLVWLFPKSKWPWIFLGGMSALSLNWVSWFLWGIQL